MSILLVKRRLDGLLVPGQILNPTQLTHLSSYRYTKMVQFTLLLLTVAGISTANLTHLHSQQRKYASPQFNNKALASASLCGSDEAICDLHYCVPSSGACCSSGKGGYCDVGTYCFGGGCCKTGETCTAPPKGCNKGYAECNGNCIPEGDTCCDDGTSCPSGQACTNYGTCSEGAEASLGASSEGYSSTTKSWKPAHDSKTLAVDEPRTTNIDSYTSLVVDVPSTINIDTYTALVVDQSFSTDISQPPQTSLVIDEANTSTDRGKHHTSTGINERASTHVPQATSTSTGNMDTDNSGGSAGSDAEDGGSVITPKVISVIAIALLAL